MYRIWCIFTIRTVLPVFVEAHKEDEICGPLLNTLTLAKTRRTARSEILNPELSLLFLSLAFLLVFKHVFMRRINVSEGVVRRELMPLY